MTWEALELPASSRQKPGKPSCGAQMASAAQNYLVQMPPVLRLRTPVLMLEPGDCRVANSFLGLWGVSAVPGSYELNVCASPRPRFTC